MNENITHASSVQRYGTEGSLVITFISLVLVGSLILLSFLAFFLFKKIPSPQYFGVTDDRKIFTLPALNQPSLSIASIQQWSAIFALNAHTFDFNNIDQQIMSMQNYFTSDGFKQFLESVASFRDEVVKNQLIVSSIPIGAPVVQKNIIKNDTYQWIIELPVQVRFESSSTTRDERRTIRLTAVRVPTENNPYGIAISQYQSVKKTL